MRSGDHLVELSKLIVGQWSNMAGEVNNFGVTKDDYFSNGTKSIEIVIQKAGEKQIYKAKAKWSITKNILSEEVTEIDKKAVKAFGFKKGFKTRAYIQLLDNKHLIMKQLNTGSRHLSEPVTLIRT
jgi:hypothetical protein